MEGKIVQVAYDVLAVLIPALVGLAMEYLRRKLGTEKMEKLKKELAVKKELAILAVRFVEQVYKDLHGPEKYQKAAEWLSARAAEYGFNVTPDEIKGLIEAAIRELKDSLGEEWAKVGFTGR